MLEPSRLVVLTALALRPPGAAITVGVSAGGAVIASLALVPGGDGILGGALALLMLLIAAIDWRHYIIPDELTLSALVLGLAQASILRTGDADALTAALLRGVMAAMVFFVLRATYRYLRGQDGMGLGDVKLAGVAGVWLDWMTLPLAIEIAALTGLVIYAARYRFVRYRMRSTTKVPFGLFFAPSIWISWLLQSHSFILPLVSG
jgi:leader peptidase (prepilin peptidase) / N-methyltransferase